MKGKGSIEATRRRRRMIAQATARLLDEIRAADLRDAPGIRKIVSSFYRLDLPARWRR
jgi:hypothetical protein